MKQNNIPISKQVKTYIDRKPYIVEAIEQNIVNYSALSREICKNLNLKKITNWITGDIEVIHGSFDTILQNPPFGVQKRKADRRFITKSQGKKFDMRPRWGATSNFLFYLAFSFKPRPDSSLWVAN